MSVAPARRRSATSRLPLLVGLLVAVAAAPFLPGPPRAAAAAPDGDVIDVAVEVRHEATLLSLGKPHAGAWVALAAPGERPADLEASALATDPEGRAVVTGVPAAGGRLLVWAAERAPRAVWARRTLDGPVVLEPALALDVVVRDPGGAPAADAMIEVHVELPVSGAPAGADALHRYVLRVPADGDGRARFEGLPPTSLRVRASADGRVAAEAYPVRAGAASVVLALTRGAQVEGRVVVIPGGGGEGVLLRLGERDARVLTGGEFAFDAVRPGAAELLVVDPDLHLREPLRLSVSEGDRRTGLSVTLVRSATLSGTVTDDRGAPVLLADVDVAWPVTRTAWSGLRRSFPGAVVDGRFRLDHLPPADGVAIEVRASGRSPVIVQGLSLPAGQQHRPLEIRLERGALLTGQVVAPSGAYLPGMTVEARPLGDALDRAAADRAETGPGGLFLLDALPREPISIRVVPPPGSAFRPTTFGPFTPGVDKAARTQPLVLAPGHTVRGRVEQAPADATCSVTGSDGVTISVPLAQGAFEIEGLPTGDATLVVRSASVDGVARAELSLPAGWPLDLRWQSALGLTLRLVGPGDQPVTRARIVAHPVGADEAVGAGEDTERSVVVEQGGDVDGLYRLALLRGSWRVAARSEGLVAVAELSIGDESPGVVTLHLDRGETIRGEVADREGGTPIEGAEVVVVPLAGSAAPQVRAVTDARGAFVVPGVLPGVVRLRVSAPGRASHVSLPLSVQRASTLDAGRIELTAGARVVGWVIGRRGAPLRGAAVVLAHDDGPRARATTDLHGSFEIPNLPPGGALLEVAGRAQRIYVPPGRERVELVVDLGGGTVLEGAVRSEGRPVAFAAVVAWSASLRQPVVVSGHADAFGAFSLAPLPPGPVVISVRAPGSAAGVEHAIELPVAADHRVELNLPSGAVAGEVLESTGGAIAGVNVRVWLLGGAVGREDALERLLAETTTDLSGRFHVDRLPAGDVEIEASRAGHGGVFSGPIRVDSDALTLGVSLRLDDEARVSAQIVDERDVPLAGAWLEVEPYTELTRGPGVTLRVKGGGDGRLALRGLAPGAWSVAVGGPGRGRRELGVIDLREGDNDLGRLDLARGGALRVLALHAGFFPAAGVRIAIEDPIGRDPRPREDLTGPPLTARGRLHRTEPDGVLVVPDLAPGTYRVRPAGAPPEQAIAVRVIAGEAAAVSVWMPAFVAPDER